jgi:putative spermidine/putrescine transport system ATP-binding protein
MTPDGGQQGEIDADGDVSYLELRQLAKRFGDVLAVEEVSLSVDRGELVSLLGPSGCGKTTLLRMTAGLEAPDVGEVYLDGEDITGVPSYLRRMGMVFQSPALFPNLRVRDNVAFGLRVAGQGNAAMGGRVRELIDLVGLTGRADHYPHQLSGGEQQRVALARALAVEPRVLLLDEPLTALDAPLRASLRTEIRRIQQRLRVTALYVTHDQEEALSLSDRVVVMNCGRIEEIGRPLDLYRAPRSAFTAAFIGSSTSLVGEVVNPAEGLLSVGGLRVRASAAAGLPAGTRVRLLIRAETVRLLSPLEPDPPGANCFTGTLLVKSFRGPATILEVDIQGAILRAEVASEAADPLDAGKPLRLAVGPEACRIIQPLSRGVDKH